MKIAWHAIVKNEAAIIDRCMKSLLPHIDGAIVADTGSTDGTPDLIKQAFAAAGKPVEVHSIPFENFAQARNDALHLARASSIDYSYLLLVDADMELVCDQTPWLNGENGLAYDMQQTAGSTTYWNRRLLSRKAHAIYRSPTHEYLDVGSAGRITGARFVDHADGANRSDKFERDLALLEKALDTETNPGLIQRYHFYLGQTYFDLKRWQDAAIHYQRRVELGGWDEEVWNAQMRYAHCLGNQGLAAEFVYEMLKAYEMRPQRAEVLYDLAKFFREMGHANRRSVLFSAPGITCQRPADSLFVNDWVYNTGLKNEYSICAFYDERHRRSGKEIINQLALDRSADEHSRDMARFNQYWYLSPLKEHVKSFEPTRIPFQPPDGWAAMNPSVINRDGKPLILVRTVNYTITEAGHYVSRTGDLAPCSTPVIRTRNWLVRLAPSGAVASSNELHLPVLPPPEFELVRGFEDSRLFEWRGELWTLSTVRELTHEGWCEQVLAPIMNADGMRYGGQVIKILPKVRQHEKNWMPWPRGDQFRAVYRLGTLIGSDGEFISEEKPWLATDHISGGSQVVQVDDRTWIALVHEARAIPGRATRYYQHRFVSFWPNGRVDRISQPFYFHDRQIEFAAGLALIDGKVVVSYGVRDEEAWLATMDLKQVIEFIYQGGLAL